MKKALLTIAILLFTGLSVDVLAQRKRSDDRKPSKEATLNNKNRRDSKNYADDRNSNVVKRDKRGNQNYSNNNRNRQNSYGKNKSRDNRLVRVVDRRVSRDRGWRNTGSSITVGFGNNRFYDYDFRSGRRFLVNRGYRPSNRHIWLAGHWRYNPRLRRDVWVDGLWSIRRANHRWIPGRYQRLNGVRIWVDGRWSVVY